MSSADGISNTTTETHSFVCWATGTNAMIRAR